MSRIIYITIENTIKSIKDWCKYYDINPDTVYKRRRVGHPDNADLFKKRELGKGKYIYNIKQKERKNAIAKLRYCIKTSTTKEEKKRYTKELDKLRIYKRNKNGTKSGKSNTISK